MSEHRIVEFINLHATCGEIRQEWTSESASLLCRECGATAIVDFTETSEADLWTAFDDAIGALGLSHDERLVLSDVEVEVGAVVRIIQAHPPLKALLDAQYDAAAKARTKH